MSSEVRLFKGGAGCSGSLRLRWRLDSVLGIEAAGSLLCSREDESQLGQQQQKGELRRVRRIVADVAGAVAEDAIIL